MEPAGAVPYRFTGIDTRLAVRLLGTFEVMLMGKPVSLSARAAQSLLAYLLLTQGVSHRREKLAGMFWPEVAEDKARSYLRHELWRIRKALTTKGDPGFLLSDNLTVSFILSKDTWLDVDRLRDAKDATTIEDLKSALSVYEGDLLPGFYDEWILREREQIQGLYEETASRLLELLITKKRWHDVVEWAERWISHGQGSEAAYRALMAAYDAMGDRARVAASYKRCVEALHELGLEPSEQTRTLALKRTAKLKLPLPMTSFIGRERELEEVAQLISSARLVTFTGSGGVGKTRLAIQVVAEVLDRFPDGIWFLDLAPVSDPMLVPNAVAAVLEIQQEAASESFTQAIASFLRPLRALLIFDNCEHLIDSCARLVESLLALCGDISILATSREVLRVPGEVPYRLPSLERPRLDVDLFLDVIGRNASVRLFLERARAVSSGFALTMPNALVIAKICQRLDGIPLAIELAAARVKVLTVEQILGRLDDRFNLLTGGTRNALPRHQTLRAAIEWSYDLLSEKERLLFRRLAVFNGGWSLEAAEAVCSGNGTETREILDILSQLIDKSLVQVHTVNSENRYRRLETIRQFANEKLLASGERDLLRKQHCAFFLDLAEHAYQETNLMENYKWKIRLELDDDNFRSALTWCLTQENSEFSLRLLGYWKPGRGHRYSEICNWFEKIRALPNKKNHPALYAKLLNDIGRISWYRRNIPYAVSVLEESQAIWLELGEGGEVGLAESWICLSNILLLNREHVEQAQSLVNQSLVLYQKHGCEKGISQALFCLGKIALSKCDYVEAERQFMRSYAKWQELGDSFELAHALNSLGELARQQDDYDKAAKYYEQCLRIHRELRDFTLLSILLFNYAWVLLRRGDYIEAKALIDENLYISTEDGDRIGILYCFPGFAGVLVMIGRFREAARLFSAFESLFSTSGSGPLEPPDQKEFDYFLKLVREQLDKTSFATFWEEGSKMTLEQAIAFALKETSL